MILLVLALLAAAPTDDSKVLAAGAAPASQPATVAANDDLNRVVCRMSEETGTRLGAHKECHTRREWAQMSSDAGDVLESAGRRGATTMVTGH